MKTEKQSEMAKRYKLAEQMVWAKLAYWQKLAITEDRTAQKTGSVFDSFTKQVIALAESSDFTTKTLKKELTSSLK